LEKDAKEKGKSKVCYVNQFSEFRVLEELGLGYATVAGLDTTNEPPD
jgi:hypothetical protein